ncbi:MAG: ZIP family metal transporter [Gammaproteobacteria bacterium]|nr:ZIP family metal transporter [Gammaproteobacteria bacterium]
MPAIFATHGSAGVLACLLAASGTVAGALPALWMRTLSRPVEVAALASAAGLMLAAATLGLLDAAFSLVDAHGTGRGGRLGIIVAFIVGVGFIALLNHVLPHEHFVKGAEGGRHGGVSRTGWSHPRIWLLVIAIAIHKIPEGLAVGAGFGAPDNPTAWPVAAGITLQNVPEGLVVATSLRVLGYTRAVAAVTAASTGILGFAGGMLGLGTGALFIGIVPLLLAVASGAMIYVVGGEIIPESHRHGDEDNAALSLIAGFVSFLLLDLALV